VVVRFQDLDLSGQRLIIRQGNGQCWLTRRVSAAGKAIEIKDRYPHCLRHTCAIRLIHAGMDITRIQKLLGHKMINTAMIYAKVQDATVEADYRQALHKIEQHHMPLSEQPVSVEVWPTRVVNVQEASDSSVQSFRLIYTLRVFRLPQGVDRTIIKDTSI
jgi:hypothetical protein